MLSGVKGSPGVLSVPSCCVIHRSCFVVNLRTQGAFPDRVDLLVLARLSFHPALVEPFPRPAARLVPCAHPRRRRTQPRACPARLLGRHSLITLLLLHFFLLRRLTWKHDISCDT